MAEAVDLGHRRAPVPHRARLLTGVEAGGLDAWLGRVLGGAPGTPTLYEQALTHGSREAADYQRLEFLGDRVLGLAIAEWLFTLFPGESEGELSKRLNALVARAVCADVARALGVQAHVRLGKQARDDGAGDSDNVLGDVMEALIGARFLDAGLDAARALVRAGWAARVTGPMPRHPKSALLEWTAAHRRANPAYAIEDRSGPDHAPRFRVRVAVGRQLSATGEGRSKQEAEIAAAAALLAQVEAR